MFFDLAKYGIIIAANLSGQITCQNSVFQMMKGGSCVKETCTGTISNKMVEGEDEEMMTQSFRKDKIEDQVKSTATGRGHEDESRISSRISLKHKKIDVPSSRGVILFQGNTYNMCKVNIKQIVVDWSVGFT